MDVTRRRQDSAGSSSDGSSSGSSGSSIDNTCDDDKAALSALEAHFAKNFDLPLTNLVERKTSVMGKRKQHQVAKQEELRPSISVERESQISLPKAVQKAAPQTIVFGEASNARTSSGGGGEATSGWKSFMSSKVKTRTDEEKAASRRLATKKSPNAKIDNQNEDKEEKDDQDEKQAQSNDKALSELLSTTLFAPGGAGSITRRSNGKPILGSNDTLAKLLELSQPTTNGKAQNQGRGYGEAMLKSQNMAKMPLTIRHGLRRAEMEKQDKELQRQKELGNYHHSIKSLITKKDGLDLIMGTKDKDRSKRTREKGLSMGVGKFSGGMLKLSEQDISRINKPNSSHKKRRRNHE